MGMKMRKKPDEAFILLIRTATKAGLKWEPWGTYPSSELAEKEYDAKIRGRGITAWSWIGPTEEGLRILRGELEP